MRIRVFASDCDPALGRFLLKKSLPYCKTEVRLGRAHPIDPTDITAGIQLVPTDEIVAKNRSVERRGSPEANGCLTANESQLNAGCRISLRDTDLTRQLRQLSDAYEFQLEKHERDGRKGMPRACAEIAAKAKTLLSDPSFICA